MTIWKEIKDGLRDAISEYVELWYASYLSEIFRIMTIFEIRKGIRDAISEYVELWYTSHLPEIFSKQTVYEIKSGIGLALMSYGIWILQATVNASKVLDKIATTIGDAGDAMLEEKE